MSFFDKMKKGVSDAGSKAKSLVEVNKFRLNIQSLEAEIQDRYKRIGQAVYQSTSDEIGSEPELDQKTNVSIVQLSQEIRFRQQEITALNKKILELNHQKSCNKCGRLNQLEVKYCSECGHEFTQVVTIDIVAERAATENADFTCSKCQEPFGQNDRFCGKCGASRQ
ncbi:zinc ribbon domain-containing protein [Brevibacillus sp. AY1]|uniref:zinc ribbon domain-containing protein n=1 Tax=Brevibacillus sp. AY1 TaxID=2807621 RepID=UPI0024568D90|nr:zinc ribbon domain-containing protein [Brevibacillus sp. AY1]MDH4619343.1 zinc ribbon domain-containing protein [Brevibacillus sp. AY1]